MASRLKEFLKKYGKVGVGVHLSVSAVSITGIFVAVKNNIDVESILAKWHLPGLSSQNPEANPDLNDTNKTTSTGVIVEGEKKRNRTAELASSTAGALTLAVLLNKALFPVRVPITIALTPPVARFLARRKIYKNSI